MRRVETGEDYLAGCPVFEDSADPLIIRNLQITTDFYGQWIKLSIHQPERQRWERCKRQMKEETCERDRLHVLTHLSISTCRVICLNLRSDVKEFVSMPEGFYITEACLYCYSTKYVLTNRSLLLKYCILHAPWYPWAVRGYWVWVSGRPMLLSLTAFRTRSSLHVWTNWSGLKSVRKHFPKDAAC